MGSDGDEEAPVFKKMSDDLRNNEEDDETAPAVDLFSEIHLGQLKKLEKQLENTETEKISLTTNVREVNDNLESARKKFLDKRLKFLNFWHT